MAEAHQPITSLTTQIAATGAEQYSWTQEPWYSAHTVRWDALKAQGWQFRQPLPLHHRIGLTIFRDNDEYTMYIAKTTPEEIHTEMLERCEYHAANFQPLTVGS